MYGFRRDSRMRFDRSNADVFLLMMLVVAGVSVGELPRTPQVAGANSAVDAYREARLEWTDSRVEEVVVATPPWQVVVEEPPPANPAGFAGGAGASSAV